MDMIVTPKKYGAVIDTVFGDTSASGMMSTPTKQSVISFDGVKHIRVDYALYRKFYDTRIVSATFPDLEDISGYSAMAYCFYNATSVTSISFPKLRYVSGVGGLDYAFGRTGMRTFSAPMLEYANTSSFMLYNNANLQTAFLPRLIRADGSNIGWFQYDANLKDINLNSLSHLTANVSNMFQGTTYTQSVKFPSLIELQHMPTNWLRAGLTYHFQKMLEDGIKSLPNYPFGANESDIVFDLVGYIRPGTGRRTFSRCEYYSKYNGTTKTHTAWANFDLVLPNEQYAYTFGNDVIFVGGKLLYKFNTPTSAVYTDTLDLTDGMPVYDESGVQTSTIQAFRKDIIYTLGDTEPVIGDMTYNEDGTEYLAIGEVQ